MLNLLPFPKFKASVRAMSLPRCAEVLGGRVDAHIVSESDNRVDAHIVSESDNTAAPRPPLPPPPAYLCPSRTNLLLSVNQVASALSRGRVC